MQIDSYKPAIFQVVIVDTGLETTAPSDGFIDCTSVARYRQLQTQTGTEAAPTVNDGDVIFINGRAVNFTTDGGLDLAGIIDTINALTDVHHVIASDNGGLELINEPLYENFGITVTGEVSVLEAIGFVNPTKSVVPGATPADMDLSLAKTRANSRWENMLKLLNFEATTANVGSVVKDGGDVDTAPSEISFSVTYYSFPSIYTYDELNDGVILYGTAAIKRMVARALVAERSEVRVVYNPTVITPPAVGFQSGDIALTVEIGALAADLLTAEANITVSHIGLTR